MKYQTLEVWKKTEKKKQAGLLIGEFFGHNKYLKKLIIKLIN